MATYRKRTPNVEALRLSSRVPAHDLHAFLGTLNTVRIQDDGRGVVISTPQGDLPVPEGNWIIKDEKGALTATDPHSFNAQYEAVDEQSTNGN